MYLQYVYTILILQLYSSFELLHTLLGDFVLFL